MTFSKTNISRLDITFYIVILQKSKTTDAEFFRVCSGQKYLIWLQILNFFCVKLIELLKFQLHKIVFRNHVCW